MGQSGIWGNMKIENIVQGTDPNLTLVCLVSDEASSSLLLNSVAKLQIQNFTVYLIKVDVSDYKFMAEQAGRLLLELDKVGFKRSTLIAFGRASAVAQIALAQNAQIVRRAIMLNPETRDKPDWWTNFRETCQKRWSLPLPFRLDTAYFDIRHLAHRVACPLLIIRAAGEDVFLKDSALELSKNAPSAYLLEGDFATLLSSSGASARWELNDWFVNLCREFVEVPAKRSQKNLGGKSKLGEKNLQADLPVAA